MTPSTPPAANSAAELKKGTQLFLEKSCVPFFGPGFHKFYSETRQDWVSTKDIHDNEVIRGRAGPLTITASRHLPGTQRVYNLTVEGEHVYYVSELGLLAHNMQCSPRQLGPHAPGDVPDSFVVVRGGTADLPGPGVVFSGAQGRTLSEAGAGVPHGQLRSTTAGQIRARGGTVEVKPELTRSGTLNPTHVNVTFGDAQEIFSPLQPNPVATRQRIR